MKKLVLLFASLMMGVALNAQILNITGQLGVKAGINYTNLSSIYDSRTSFNAGITYEYPITSSWALAPELMFSSQGTKLIESDDYTKIVSSYINVPILAKLYVLKKLSVEFGPQFGFLMSAKEKTEYSGQKSEVAYNENYINTFDLSVALGASFHVTSSIYVNFRYNLGLTDMLEESYFGENKNRVFQLGVGYKF